jgi:hypothetical protein
LGSPFPGMDPFLEDPAYWPDLHSRFINNWADALSDVLPEQYEANLAERVYLVEHDPEARKLIYADASERDMSCPFSIVPRAGGRYQPKPYLARSVGIPIARLRH